MFVLNAKEQMEMAEQHMRTIKMGIEAGVITPEKAQEELRVWSERTGVWTKL